MPQPASTATDHVPGPAVRNRPTLLAGQVSAPDPNWLRKHEFRAGCPVAGVALDVTPDSPLHAVVAQAFADWRGVLEHAFTAEGCPPASARALAALVVASAEGALLLARAERDLRPYEDVAAQVLAHLRHALPATRTPASTAADPAR